VNGNKNFSNLFEVAVVNGNKNLLETFRSGRARSKMLIAIGQYNRIEHVIAGFRTSR
jgi:hypothetical protein